MLRDEHQFHYFYFILLLFLLSGTVLAGDAQGPSLHKMFDSINCGNDCAQKLERCSINCRQGSSGCLDACSQTYSRCLAQCNLGETIAQGAKAGPPTYRCDDHQDQGDILTGCWAERLCQVEAMTKTSSRRIVSFTRDRTMLEYEVMYQGTQCKGQRLLVGVSPVYYYSLSVRTSQGGGNAISFKEYLGVREKFLGNTVITVQRDASREHNGHICIRKNDYEMGEGFIFEEFRTDKELPIACLYAHKPPI